MRKIVIGVIIWLALGLPGVGMSLAYFDRAFPGECRRHAAFSYTTIAGGPINTVVAFLHTEFAASGVQFICKQENDAHREGSELRKGK